MTNLFKLLKQKVQRLIFELKVETIFVDDALVINAVEHRPHKMFELKIGVELHIECVGLLFVEKNRVQLFEMELQFESLLEGMKSSRIQLLAGFEQNCAGGERVKHPHTQLRLPVGLDLMQIVFVLQQVGVGEGLELLELDQLIAGEY